MLQILGVSIFINIVLSTVVLINYKPNDWNAIYNVHYKIKCNPIGESYPEWTEEHHITILYSESRNKYKVESSDNKYKTRLQYNQIIEMLNQYNKK